MTEQIVDLRTAVRAIRRRRVSLVALCLVGVVAGVLLPSLRQETFAARSRVLLPPPPGRDAQGFPFRDIQTEVVVATNSDVLARAGKAVDPPLPASALHRLISVRPVSTEVLEVQARTSSPGLAVLLSNAVADEYAAYANRVQSAEADATIAELEDQAKTLDQRIQELQARIEATSASLGALSATSAEALGTMATLNDLRADQDDAEQLLNAVNDRLGEARLTSTLSRRGTQVLDRAASAESSRAPPLLTGGAGGIVGLIAGGVLALTLAQADRRLRRRKDIAVAVGAEVLVSFRLPRTAASRVVPKARALQSMLRDWSPSAVEGAALRQALTKLGVYGDKVAKQLVIAVLPGDRAAHLMALEVAALVAALSTRSGTRTDLVLSGDSAGELSEILEESINRVDGLRGHIVVRAFTESQLVGSPRTELTVWVCVVAPGPFLLPTAPGRTSLVLGVSAGHATDETLSATADACLEAGQPVQAVFLVNPDPTDPTTGLLTPMTAPASDGGDVWGHAGPNGQPAPAPGGLGSRRG